MFFRTDPQKRKNADGTETIIEVECVSLRIAGNMLEELSSRLTISFARGSPTEYAAHKAGKESINGTPLSCSMEGYYL